MVKMREPNPELEKQIEAFGDAAEKPARPRFEDQPKWARRNQEKKEHGFNLRLSDSQLQLIKAGTELEGVRTGMRISQQKFVERELWPLLEEKYGYLLEE